jgi:glycosyltransferase involved in cell wall biosynthesis
MSGSRMTLVVPAYNEAGRLDREAFGAFVDDHSHVALHFVDDGSSDDTAAVLAALSDGRADRITVQVLDRNGGKAEAVRLGMLDAAGRGAECIGFIDADLAAPLDQSLLLLAELDAHPRAWAAIGSRVRLLGRDISRSTLRHYLGRVFATGASLTLGLPVYDTQCGLKLFRNLPGVRATLQAPFASRWIFDVELLARLAAVPDATPPAERIREVPLEQWAARDGSRLRVRDFLRAPLELLAIRRRRGHPR